METANPEVWRTKLRSLSADHEQQVAYCLTTNQVGFGWSPAGVKSGRGKEKLDQVCSAVAKEKWPNWGQQGSRQIRRFAEADHGDYVWVRDTKGHYLLCRLEGPWRFVSAQDNPKSGELDLHQLRKVRWAKKSLMPQDAPGVLVNAFSGPGESWCHVGRGDNRDEFARWTHNYFWRLLNGGRPSTLSVQPEIAIASMLTWSELEDIVLVWLQWEHDYVLVPSSRGASTPHFECVLVARKGRGRAKPQVKTGVLNWDSLGKSLVRNERGFGFSAKGLYRGTKTKQCVEIDIDDLIAFATSSDGRRLLPDSVLRWFS